MHVSTLKNYKRNFILLSIKLISQYISFLLKTTQFKIVIWSLYYLKKNYLVNSWLWASMNLTVGRKKGRSNGNFQPCVSRPLLLFWFRSMYKITYVRKYVWPDNGRPCIWRSLLEHRQLTNDLDYVGSPVSKPHEAFVLQQ